MLGGFIKYLRRCGFKDRGTYKVSNQKGPDTPSKRPFSALPMTISD